MGIKQLYQAIEKYAPQAIHKTTNQSYVNQKIAIDASVMLYQFLSSIQQNGQPFTNSKGEVTSHIIGLLARCTHLAEAGIKPIFVFDGAAGSEKASELNRRKELKQKAEEKAKQAQEAGNEQEFEKQQKRSVRVTPAMTAQAKQLLDFLGYPYIQAPGEAEITCVALTRSGVATGVASSDLDCVCHGASKFIRNIGTDKEVSEIRYNQVLEGFQFTREQFVDYCILMGCDYCDTLPGVGPKKAYELISEHKTIEAALAVLNERNQPSDRQKWLDSIQIARNVFLHGSDASSDDSNTTPAFNLTTIKFLPCQKQKCVDFLCGDLEFDRDSAIKRVDKFDKARRSQKQTTLAGFLIKKSKP